MEEKYADYLVSVSKKLLLENGQTADQDELKNVENIVMAQLSARYLKDVGCLQYCGSLKICILSGNFLSNIDALESCTGLNKLDLHSNQMKDLPGPSFWKNMKNLCLLYLHDNTISDLENVHSLSFCPNLIALTLFSTPLSLKIAYRHIVVNSIISLKALDYYVISDEEIVESWRLPKKYKPFTLNFFVDFCPPPRKVGLDYLVAVIEARIAEHYPKVVVGMESAEENYISGRNENGKKDNFQDQSHSVSLFSNPDYSEMDKRIFTKKKIVILLVRAVKRMVVVRLLQQFKNGFCSPLCHPSGLIPLHEVLLHKRNIRVGKKEICIQVTPTVCDTKRSVHHIIKPAQHSEVEKLTSGIQVLNVKDLKELHLYLKGLRQPVLSAVLKFEEKKKIKQKELKRLPKTDLMDLKDEKEIASQFRLSVGKMPFYYKTVELQEYQERQKNFFDDVYNLHLLKKPLPEIKPVHNPGCIERRAFVSAYGSIRLRPLCAVDKAYRENQKLDILLRKERDVMQMQISQNVAKEYTDQSTEKRVEYLQKIHGQEKFVVRDFLKERQEERAMLIRKIRQKHVKFLKSKETKTVERTFIQGFSCQHASLTKGLFRLDGWRSRKQSIDKRSFIVKTIVEEHKQQKDMFKYIQEQRLTMLQVKRNAEKMFRKYMVDEMAKERSKKVKEKVAAIKKPSVKIMYNLPVADSSGHAVPLQEYDG